MSRFLILPNVRCKNVIDWAMGYAPFLDSPLSLCLQQDSFEYGDDLDDIYGDIGTYRAAQPSSMAATQSSAGPPPTGAAPAGSQAAGPLGSAAMAGYGTGYGGAGQVAGAAVGSAGAGAAGAGMTAGGAEDEQLRMSAIVDQVSSDWQRSVSSC